MRTKILIIKLGYSETLDPEIGKVPSLGDVLRTTPILWALRERFPTAQITWLVSGNAEPLLQGNTLLDRILVWDEFVPFQLLREKFDILINLEKIAGVCALADMIDAWTKYGFRFDSVTGQYQGYEKGLNFMNYIANKKSDVSKGFWQQVLIEMLGIPWQRQPYLIGYKPSTTDTFDIGFNHEVGSKWPYKALPHDVWKELGERFTRLGYTVSWQEGNNNLFRYMDWINSCRLLLTNDSLGLHMALAFNKQVIGLFGPTDPSEVYFYTDSSVIVSPVDCECMPCGSPRCVTGKYCMQQITADTIEKAVIQTIKPTGN